MADYQVNPAALKQTAAGINDAMAELRSIGMAEGAEVGRGFDELELSGLQIGHSDVKSAFDEFCERWQWMVRGLVQQGNEIADKLHLSAGIYHDQEEYLSGTLKDVVNAAVGDPNRSQDEVEKQSWSQLSNSLASDMTPDYSAKSFEAAAKHSEATWVAESADVTTNSNIEAMSYLLNDHHDLAAAQAQAQAKAQKLNQEAANLGWKD